jgi:uncharacterized protein YjbI with pentapeptide repeats
MSKSGLDYSNLGCSSFKRANLNGASIFKAEANQADFQGANLISQMHLELLF